VRVVFGIAISEAIEDTARNPGAKYSLGSVLNHVCLHQSVIGQEVIKQMEMAGEDPDVIIGCAGGGSNFAGLAFPFLQRKIKAGKDYRVIAAEPASCPSLTKGELRYDFGDSAATTPLMMMHTLGHRFMPPSIHAGGLRYHGMSPMVSHCAKLGLIEAVAVPQMKVFHSAVQFARSEGIVPAPESAHAISVVVDEAMRCRAENRRKVIVFNLSGNGLLDLAAYDSYLCGNMQETEDR
jgi:tryptophan synthase beta chain